MGGLCGGSRATRRTPRERARQRTGAEEAVRRGQVTRRTGLDDLIVTGKQTTHTISPSA